MARKGKARVRALIDLVREQQPNLDATEAIRSGLVRVNGVVVGNPASRVRDDVPIAVGQAEQPLRGEEKLAAALRIFAVTIKGCVALDLGAAAGGFTRALLRAGAARVYAVDTGYGQLVGSLRQDRRVVNLERTNLAELNRDLVPDEVQVVTADLSYVPLAEAVPQLEGPIVLSVTADLLALVKPQFELGLSATPTAEGELRDAVRRACSGIEVAGWQVLATAESPVKGRRGATEYLLHARRRRF